MRIAILSAEVVFSAGRGGSFFYIRRRVIAVSGIRERGNKYKNKLQVTAYRRWPAAGGRQAANGRRRAAATQIQIQNTKTGTIQNTERKLQIQVHVIPI